MNPPTEPMLTEITPERGHIAIVYCNEPFRFAAGHRMRAANCLICGQVIGGEDATVIGAAALAGGACRCGGIVSDVFLAHAAHFPMPPDQLQAAIRRGLQCDSNHQ